MNGSVVAFWSKPTHRVPPANESFIALCTGDDVVCAIRNDHSNDGGSSGSVYCWSANSTEADPYGATNPASSGAIHDDYISITCLHNSFCATRRDTHEVYCWGWIKALDTMRYYIAQPPMRGPWLKVFPSSPSIKIPNYYGML
jgi:hypothetical protein